MDLQEHGVNMWLPGHLLMYVASVMKVRDCEAGCDENALIHTNRII